MPRPRPRRGASSWTAPRFQLSKEAWADLVWELGYTETSDKVPANFIDTINEVERWVGFYPGAVEATKTAQRAAVVKGRPKNDPLMTLIGKLRLVFAHEYVGGESKREPKRGSLPLSQREECERAFVKCALEAAGIECIDDVRRYFDQPGAALPSDRARMINKIARAVNKKRAAEVVRVTNTKR
jgi:hypothetical protein